LDKAEEKLLNAKRAIPFNAKNVIAELNEVDGFKRGLKALAVLEDELFGDEKVAKSAAHQF
jgi:soluble cytochrome b562